MCVYPHRFLPNDVFNCYVTRFFRNIQLALFSIVIGSVGALYNDGDKVRLFLLLFLSVSLVLSLSLSLARAFRVSVRLCLSLSLSPCVTTFCISPAATQSFSVVVGTVLHVHHPTDCRRWLLPRLHRRCVVCGGIARGWWPGHCGCDQVRTPLDALVMVPHMSCRHRLCVNSSCQTCAV